jgi:predicted phosphodiesterase
MKLRIYSDLHNEFHRFDPPAVDPDVDLVILAGDVDKKARGVKWANDTFQCQVAYISGNHEFYDGHIDRTLRKMRDIAESHVHVLENDSLIINGTRILGTAAWTDFSSTGDQVAASRMAWQWMNDFNYIRADVQLAQPFAGKTIVVTHHSPSPLVVGTKHDGHLNAAYTNDWPRMIEQADLWIFGHTHQAVDVELGRCRVISNPRGYPNEITGFNPHFEIDI